MRSRPIFLILLALILAACAAPTTTPTPLAPTSPPATPDPSITIVDALGRTVILPTTPQRIVITGKALFMIGDAVYLFPEASTRIVGMGQANQGNNNFIALIDPTYPAKATLEDTAGAEQIAALQPDLVILKSYLADTVGAPIEAIGIPVIYVDFETPEQYTRDIAILGQVFQNPDRAAQINAYYQQQVDSVTQALTTATATPTVLMLSVSSQDGTTSFKVPPLTWMQTILTLAAGGQPVWQDANPVGGWAQVTLEQIAAWNADHIFIISYRQDSSEVVASLLADPTWQAMRSAQNGQLHAFPADLYSWDQPDTRWILGLNWLAGRLHPGLFPNQDITASARDFYALLYGLDEAFFTTNILPTFHGDLP